MSKKLTISLIIIAVITVLSIWAFNSSMNLTKNVNRFEQEEDLDGADKAKVEELIITETRNSQKFWEVYASSGQYDHEKNMAKLTEVKGNFYKNNKVVLSFDAPIAFYNDKNKEIKLSGGARALTDDNVFITAKEFNWAGNKDEITAKNNVRISRGQFLSTGNLSKFSTDFSRFEMSGNVKTNMFKSNKQSQQAKEKR